MVILPRFRQLRYEAGQKTVRGTVVPLNVNRFHCDDHDQLRQHLAYFISAYNFGRRLKTLKGLTPYEFICKQWTIEPERFTLNPILQMPGLNRLLVAPFPGLVLGPILNILWLSVTEPKPGLGNYAALFTSDSLGRILWTLCGSAW